MAPLQTRAHRGTFVTSRDIDDAWQAVREHLHRTPIVKVPLLADYATDDVHAKLETRQIMGSFKTRGALARLSRPDVRQHGVVTASAGNHGLGVAWASCILGIRATVVVPKTAPRVKRLRIEELANLVEAPYAGYDEAERYARALANSNNAVFVSPFDDPHVAAGNGATVMREIAEDLPGCDAIIVPVGGGGLLAGIGRYLEIQGLDIPVIGVQPETNAAMSLSLQRGHAVVNLAPNPTLAEGLEGGVAPRTYNVAKRVLDQMITVSEESIGRAMALVFQEMGEVLEGSGAVTVAAFLENKITPRFHRPCLVFTGRHVDRAVLDRVLEAHLGPMKKIDG